MAPGTRLEIASRLRKQVDDGKPVVGAGAGTGLSAKFIEAGGADLIISKLLRPWETCIGSQNLFFVSFAQGNAAKGVS